MYIYKHKKGWQVIVKIRGQTIWGGVWENKGDAAVSRNKILRDMFGPGGLLRAWEGRRPRRKKVRFDPLQIDPVDNKKIKDFLSDL